MSSLRAVDLTLIDEVLRGDEKGYILNFSNRTFSDFFARELNVNIDADEYTSSGTSKAKRLGCFLSKVDDSTAARTLRLLWEYREAKRGTVQPDPYPLAAGQFAALITQLESGGLRQPINVIAAPALNVIEYDRFLSRLLAIRDLEPHQRGYEFERFLKDLFNAFRLDAREPFRLVGEQIDGSFELACETYLIEAKWLNRKVGVQELGAFHSKLDQKASWTRGLFVSFGGFSDVGLTGFGKGRRLIAMDGKDIYDCLSRGIAIDRLISLKVRHAAETGEIFVTAEALFP